MKLYSRILLLGGFFLFSTVPQVKANTVLADKFVFKVANEVFTVKNLKTYFDQLQNLKCIYPETLLARVFDKEFSQDSNKWYFVSPKFNQGQQVYFNTVISFSKLLVYSKSHNVTVKKSLKKYFYLSAKNLKCGFSAFETSRELKPQFEEILRLEIFMRSRFLPTEQAGKSTKADIVKAVKSAKDLINSIDKQIDQEVYW